MYRIKPNHLDSLRTGCQLLAGTPLDHDSTTGCALVRHRVDHQDQSEGHGRSASKEGGGEGFEPLASPCGDASAQSDRSYLCTETRSSTWLSVAGEGERRVSDCNVDPLTALQVRGQNQSTDF
jgi:hypothetical protein